MRLVSAATVVIVAVALGGLVLPQLSGEFAAHFVALLVLMPMLVAPRLFYRRHDLAIGRARGGRQAPPHAELVLLVGRGTACELFLRSLRNDPESPYWPVGILDDTPGTRGSCIHDIPILGGYQDSDAVRKELAARGTTLGRIILTEPLTHSATEELSPLLGWARMTGLAVSQLPPLSALRPVGGDHGLTDLNVTELLERQEAQVDYDAIRRLVEGHRILITGAGGSIGSELTRQIASLRPAELVLVENCELNSYQIEMDLERHYPQVPRRSYICCIRDDDRLREIFYRHRPELVFNAAALKHVPIVEQNPCEGVLTNVIGARNVADIALETGALAMIQISTDKAVNAYNVMGATKRVAEFYCQALDRRGGTRFMTVRFGNVLGSSGSLIPLFKRQIDEGGPLTVTDPRMTRFFMTIREAVELTLLASASGLEKAVAQGQIMVLDMGKPIPIVDIAQRMIRLAGLTPGVDIKIKTIGIRPGEKLFEELFDKAEARAPSVIQGVHVATPDGRPLPFLRDGIAALERAARRGQSHLVVATLAEIVPGYAPVGLHLATAPSPDEPKRPDPLLTAAKLETA
ncbi:polysaccharide biosynthesis protein [Palleronia marisminoris]|nr:nucleoside-diphosphate sugar epimerase/dehydratase [Palleronia marisminoris]